MPSAVYSSQLASDATATIPRPQSNVAADKEQLSLSMTSLPNVKDQRAYERERQRVKKAEDVVKMRERKRSKWAKLFDPSRAGQAVTSVPSEKDMCLRAEEVDTLDGVLIESSPVARERVAPSSDSKVEVKLTDLISSSKPRKRQESDFEVIPHLRSVIVLDDIATHDLTIDEPWEHIYGESESDDQGSTKEPSYAKILAPSK